MIEYCTFCSSARQYIYNWSNKKTLFREIGVVILYTWERLRPAQRQHPLWSRKYLLTRLRLPLITLWDDNFSLSRPIKDTFPITAFMHCAEIWQRSLVIFDPTKRNDACVSTTEEIYTQHFDTVVLKDSRLSAKLFMFNEASGVFEQAGVMTGEYLPRWRSNVCLESFHSGAIWR